MSFTNERLLFADPIDTPRMERLVFAFHEMSLPSVRDAARRDRVLR